MRWFVLLYGLRPLRELFAPAGARDGKRAPYAALPLADGAPGVYCDRSAPLARRVLAGCPTLSPEGFYRPPALWGSNGHAQTILASLFRRTRCVEYARELLPTPDGGTLALDVLMAVRDERSAKGTGSTVTPIGETMAASVRNTKPVLLLTSGLGGGSQDAYVRSMAAHASECGWHVLVLNMRGCGGSAVTSPRFFSARHGSTDDVRLAVRHIRASDHLGRVAPCVAAVAWSNGATIVNNVLAEQATSHPPNADADGAHHGLDAAATLASPLNMPAADANLARPFHRHVYDRSIARGLVANFQTSGAALVFNAAQDNGGCVRAWTGTKMRVDIAELLASTTIRRIDELLTSRCFGFNSVDEYYADASSDQRLADVRVPLLVMNAFDDPLAPGNSLPYERVRRCEHVMLALTAHGGHLGWCDEGAPFGAPRWVEQTVCDFLRVATSPA
ncbi:hypothetical protein KFE25_010841 [Diacronema lutheri]|uniref:AB hydrolase-1 domain-containing protein n=1 Tax=Diacronema lutheri TaxID=2081491 RepID=A0A8J5X8L0_DIALT|nr:hypothetical protein KFE25_010841 [Diacronema lutheri]